MTNRFSPSNVSLAPPSAVARAHALRAKAQGRAVPLPPGQPPNPAPYDPMNGPPPLGKDPGAIHLPGGQALLNAKPQVLTTCDEQYFVEPDASWFGAVSPSRPINVPLGSYRVPTGEQLWFNDYEFRILRMSGFAPGDWTYAEDGRFSGILGFDVTISGRRLAHLYYELQPHPSPVTRPAFRAHRHPYPVPPRLTPDEFDVNASNDFAISAGPGTSLLPVTTRVQGPRDQPFMFVARQGETVELAAVIFNPIPSPIAGIQGRLAGFTIATVIGEAILQREMLR